MDRPGKILRYTSLELFRMPAIVIQILTIDDELNELDCDVFGILFMLDSFFWV